MVCDTIIKSLQIIYRLYNWNFLISSTQLPQEVFEEGEQRPTKLKRTKPGGKVIIENSFL